MALPRRAQLDHAAFDGGVVGGRAVEVLVGLYAFGPDGAIMGLASTVIELR